MANTGAIFRDDPFDRQTEAYRTGLTAADTLTYAAAVALPSYKLWGRGTIYLHGRFSVSGANCVVRVIYAWSPDGGTTFYAKGQSPDLTLTATTTRVSGSGAYCSQTEPVPGEGAAYIFVQVVSVSSGNVDLWVGSENG